MHSYFLLLHLLYVGAFGDPECPSLWTRRGSSSISVQFREQEPNQYTPVAVLFMPLRPVPENLTEILILPSSNTCGGQCDPRGDFDLVFFSKTMSRHLVQSKLELVQCDEVESCTIPEPTLRPRNDLAIPTLKPSTGPSVWPSYGPSQHPSFRPSWSPSVAPSFEPSKGPTTDIPTSPPSGFPVLKMKLMLEEKVLWKPQNIHLLKNLVSDMYDVPVENLQVSTVTKEEENDGVTVEMEIRDPRNVEPIDVSFEDQVFITERIKDGDSAVLEAGGDMRPIPLHELQRSKQFHALNEVICGSISEHFNDVKIRDVKHYVPGKLKFTIEATLQPNLLSFELGELEHNHRRTMVLPIPKQKLLANRMKSLDRLKSALSDKLPGVHKNDITVINLQRESDATTSVDLDIATDNPNVLDHLTHEDEAYIAEQVVRGSPTGAGGVVGFSALAIVIFVFVLLFIDFVQKKREANYDIVLEPGAALLGEPALLPVWLPQHRGEREGEASDVSDCSDDEPSISGSEGRPRVTTCGSDIIISPVPTSVSDSEIESDSPIILTSQPTLAVSTQLTDDEA